MGEDDIKLITQTFGDFEVVDATTLEELGLESRRAKSNVVASLPPPKPKRRKPSPAKSLTAPTLAIAA
jgi:type I restriction enzyme M protein